MMQTDAPFPGSYAPEDVGFLLKRMRLQPIDLPERERLMQSGQRHYSEMIGPEDRPSRERVAIFRASLAGNADRLARDLCALADALIANAASMREITLVSIARAGTPIGVLLIRLLRRRAAALGWEADSVRHYSVSIIRDRCLDLIARELALSIRDDPRFREHANLADLWAPLDICGAAAWSASEEDYVIPSSLLGGTVSGLISRSVLPRDRIGSTDFHGCVELPHLRRYDLSRWFVEKMDVLCRQIPSCFSVDQPPTLHSSYRAARLEFTQRFIEDLRREYGVRDRHRIKIGIGESVRVALRRLPERILLRDDAASHDAEIILRLASLRAIPVERRADLPYAAVAIIAEAVAQK
jgi:hypothetical protein